jgi:hypothetical protein
MKSAVFWDVTPRGSCKNRCSGGTYRLHLQGENSQRTRNMLAISSNCSALRIINHCMTKEVFVVTVNVYLVR